MMGCDIHIVLERYEADSNEWVGIWSSDVGPDRRAKIAMRDYEFFSRFGVRGSDEKTIYPRNLPKNVSRLAWFQYMRCPTDYHSASHATPDEFIAAWRSANPDNEVIRKGHELYDLLGLWMDEDDPPHRLVFWFDN